MGRADQQFASYLQGTSPVRIPDRGDPPQGDSLDQDLRIARQAQRLCTMSPIEKV